MHINLQNTTHNKQTDLMLQNIISMLETAFPARIRSFYIEGSYANSSDVGSSDIDLVVIFRNQFVDAQEQESATHLALQFARDNVIELDLEIVDERKLADGVCPALKLGSLLLYGENIRGQFSLIPLEVWTRDRMHSSYWRTVKLFNRPLPIRYPLNYPDPTSEFYGYNRRKLRLSNGHEVPCTRDLIRLVGWSATALLALKHGVYVARKSDCHQLYQTYFHDEWGQLLQDIYEQCRVQWNYLIPENPRERQMLRMICERTLAFENHFLLLYKDYVLSELTRDDVQGQQSARRILEQLPFDDEDIKKLNRQYTFYQVAIPLESAPYQCVAHPYRQFQKRHSR